MKKYYYNGDDLKDFIKEWQNSKYAELDTTKYNNISRILNLWDDVLTINDQTIFGVLPNEPERTLTEKEFFDILENGDVEEIQADEDQKIDINNKVYTITDMKNYFVSRLSKFLKNKSKNFWLVNDYHDEGYLIAINLANKSYDDLKKDDFDFYFTGSDFNIVLTLKHYDFSIENKKVLEKLFEMYPEIKIEYLKQTKKIIDEHQKIINQVSNRNIYQLTEEDKLIMEVLE